MTADGRVPSAGTGPRSLPNRRGPSKGERAADRSRERTLGQKAAGRRRRFALLVVVPVLLMLGSVYLHTVAAGLDSRAAELDVQARSGPETKGRGSRSGSRSYRARRGSGRSRPRSWV